MSITGVLISEKLSFDKANSSELGNWKGNGVYKEVEDERKRGKNGLQSVPGDT